MCMSQPLPSLLHCYSLTKVNTSALSPFEYAPNANILAAFDLNENIFFPVLCTYKEKSSGARIFLINDNIDEGIARLKSPDLAYTVTNGQVDDCKLLFLDISARPDNSWAAYDPDVERYYEEKPLIMEFNETVVGDDGELIEDLFSLVKNEELDYNDVWAIDFWLDELEKELSEGETPIV